MWRGSAAVRRVVRPGDEGNAAVQGGKKRDEPESRLRSPGAGR